MSFYIFNVHNDSILLNSPFNYQVFQKSGSTGNIIISGTYTGSPNTIEARFNNGSWQTIDAHPSSGSFSGTLNISPGQGTLDVRFSSRPTLIVSRNYVGVGDIFVCAGQSNMMGVGTNLQIYTHPTIKATLFANNYSWQELTDPYDRNTNQIDSISADNGAKGSVTPKIATDLMAELNYPIAFIPCALSGSAMSQWARSSNHQDRTTLYGSMIYRALQVGAVKAVLWWQGESDIQLHRTPSQYVTDLSNLADDIFEDLGVPIIPCLLETYDFLLSTEEDQQAYRDAIPDLPNTNSHVLLGPDFTDITTLPEDEIHLKTDAKLTLAGQRWATRLIELFYS